MDGVKNEDKSRPGLTHSGKILNVQMDQRYVDLDGEKRNVF